MTTIPTIDLMPYRLGSAADKAFVARAVGEACEKIGFFLIAGHGVDEGLVQRTYHSARSFFDLPDDEKLKVRRPSAEISRGYNLLKDQSLSYSLGVSAPPDLQESINFGPLVAHDTPYFTEGYGAVHFAPNRWPSQPADFKANAESYYRSMETLSWTIMRIFAMALDLPEDFFDGKIDKHVSSLRFVNYPEPVTPPVPSQLRAGAHTDYGALTILRVENAPGGLQVKDRAGNWIDIGYVPGTFVVNIGDLMAQWTNDRWVSTLHQVVNPPVDATLGSRRQSMVFFHQPNYDAEVACLPSCHDSSNPPKYPPTTSGAHWRGKNKAAREMALAMKQMPQVAE